jgi:hypothetical protein
VGLYDTEQPNYTKFTLMLSQLQLLREAYFTVVYVHSQNFKEPGNYLPRITDLNVMKMYMQTINSTREITDKLQINTQIKTFQIEDRKQIC